jgi:trehalose 6-phosphate synthase/phosphatase
VYTLVLTILKIALDTLAALNCFPIFLSQELHDNFYRGYCKQVLWPTFHNVDPQDHLHAPWNSVLNWADKVSVWRAAMTETVRIFDEAIAKMVSPGDIVWVHDYHLMLLPKLMRDRELDVSIVFFLHIPFPTSQNFRSLSDGYVLLQSMTCADVVGFHSFDYTRHFLNACKRLLGLRHRSIAGGILVIDVGNREVIVSMSHVSIESDMVQRALDDPDVQRMTDAIKAKHAGKKIIASVDVVQRLSGGSLRMNAFEKFLNDNMSLLECPITGSADEEHVQSKVVLVQKAIRTSARAEDEELSLSELQKMTDAINSKISGAVDLEEVHEMTLKERLALWRAADVLLITSIRDGLNMMPQEYIFARKDMESAGVVVASEFSLCSTLLNGAIKVNPFNIQNVSDMIDKVIVCTKMYGENFNVRSF